MEKISLQEGATSCNRCVDKEKKYFEYKQRGVRGG